MLRPLKRGAVSRDIQPVFTSRGERGSGVGGDGVMQLKTLYSEKPTGKFVAIYSDGSGADLFWAIDGEDGLPAYIDAEGDLVPDPETYLIDAGYCNWFPLPDNFEFFFEGRPV